VNKSDFLEKIKNDLDLLKKIADADISSTKNEEELEKIRLKLLGKKGKLSIILGGMGNLESEDRPLIGEKANILKNQISQLISNRQNEINNEFLKKQIGKETIDITLPPIGIPFGNQHPLISTSEDIVDLFCGLGYSVVDGPEIENDFYNFEALNIPNNHPARDMQDTFYLGENLLLRTHTSPVQVRYMENNPPPLRIIAPGRVFRRDASDATHSPVFHQIEVLCIDEALNFSHLRGTVMTFLKSFFGDLPIRFRASYFPFTEPSAEVDVQWRGKWLEVMGCGMVDPAVLEGMNIDPERWTGFAAGLGVERFCMVRHEIDDIRRLYTSDLRFLEQF
tara:strand:- start:21702 stop:22709 length:1008 start_codon:yes stop_codon:yes gene_type:complete